MEDSLQEVDFIVEIIFITKLPLVFTDIYRVHSPSLTYHFFFSIFPPLQESCIGAAFVVIISMYYYISRHIRNGPFPLGMLLRQLKE